MNINSSVLNLNPVQNNNFTANETPCAQCAPQMPPQQPDTVELSTFQKAKNGCKKGFKFLKENRKAIGTTAKAVGEGLLTACTVLGANQLMSKVVKTDTTALATKLATISGTTTAIYQLIKNRKNFSKEESTK